MKAELTKEERLNKILKEIEERDTKYKKYTWEELTEFEKLG